jgi:hypothetical protein
MTDHEPEAEAMREWFDFWHKSREGDETTKVYRCGKADAACVHRRRGGRR